MASVLRLFSLAVFIIIMIRLILILTGDMSANQKVTKATYWLVGVVLLSISWAMVDAIFPNANLGSPFRQVRNGEKLEIKNNYKNTRVENEKDSMYIRIDMGK